MMPFKIFFNKTQARLNALFGMSLYAALGVILLVLLAIGLAVIVFINSAAPTVLTIAGGPKDSSFNRSAERYKAILAKQGITLNIIATEGSVDNLKKLADPKIKVDVGFVMGGETKGIEVEHLMSLGSISTQPLTIFYRGKKRTLLSEFKGGRLDIGAEGSGTRTLALALLEANGIKPGDGTTLTDNLSDDPEKALRENRTDAIFLMSDSTSSKLIRSMMRDTDIRLFNFTQAEGYTRRINYLNKLQLPQGSLDFGKNIPAEDLLLIGPTVELIARDTLHPALSDVLLEAAREVHARPGLYKKRGEFPNAEEHELPVSEDAKRFYNSGKSFLYRTFPFWLASLISRSLEAIVPIILLLIPAIKIAPVIYGWRIKSRIYRWYRALLELEREAIKSSFDPARRDEFMRKLQLIEDAANKIVVPAAFGDLLYELRLHINFVRDNLQHKNPGGIAAA
ncbi:MAG: TAXI family TRAP transporter solute-binding subunit [Sideroxydans sp.]|nr:TAXI family TRAP transporter solute-binding subunit [Sideroxydans sp.]